MQNLIGRGSAPAPLERKADVRHHIWRLRSPLQCRRSCRRHGLITLMEVVDIVGEGVELSKFSQICGCTCDKDIKMHDRYEEALVLERI